MAKGLWEYKAFFMLFSSLAATLRYPVMETGAQEESNLH